MELAFPDGHSGQAGHPGFVLAADRATPVTRDRMPSIRAMRGEVFGDHVIWIGKDPTEQRALSVSAGPILDEDGTFDGAVLAYKDVTDLVTALRVKDEFVASVSHELRTPLTTIMGFLDLALEDADLDPTVRQRLTVVKRSAVRLLRLVDDLLLAAKLDEGQLSLELRETDLGAVVTDSVADLGPRAQAGEVTVRSEVAGPVVVAADPVRIRQVVDNLVGNAVKYTPPGGTVDVGLRSVARADGQFDEVELTVGDSGIGISAEDQSRLFTRFFRADDAVARGIPGIGLGLTITHAIVSAHGGTIEVESEVGRGSTFKVRLPRSSIRDFSRLAPGRSGARSPVSTKPARS
jgi:signal transduction histidine kinase